MNKANKILLLAIALLILVNAWLFFADSLRSSGGADRTIFEVSDTSQVDLLEIIGPESTITLKRDGNQWRLNDDYQVDEGLRRLFFSILQRVRVRKPVDLIPSDSIHVKLDGGETAEFFVFSNPTKTRTYFYQPSTNESFEVEIPGYNEYLGGIFELAENQWRDRLVLDENWRTIKTIYLDYLDENIKDLSMAFSNNFFAVEGVSAIDSSAVIDYLNQFQLFEVNEIISGTRFPKYDSLSKTPPIAALTITSIKSTDPRQFMIFPPIQNMAYQLISDKNDQLMIVDSQRVSQILAKPADFQVKE
ncbi:MAG: hypothetical protein ACFHWX_13475 [Bacteroidota bacterium]